MSTHTARHCPLAFAVATTYLQELEDEEEAEEGTISGGTRNSHAVAEARSAIFIDCEDGSGEQGSKRRKAASGGTQRGDADGGSSSSTMALDFTAILKKCK